MKNTTGTNNQEQEPAVYNDISTESSASKRHENGKSGKHRIIWDVNGDFAIVNEHGALIAIAKGF